MNDWRGHRVVDLGGELLDRQIVGPDDVAIGKVDDLTLARAADGTWHVTGVLIGTAALLPHLPALVRAPLRWFLRRTGSATPRWIPIQQVSALDSAVHVTAAARDAAVSPSEALVRARLARIPGANSEC
ncbi:hypothetical protein [Nocardia asteroides]|uniref:hypothetical protein n=1 Tax=Nocardia asteroides TaxID=1824 RepID=UPI001E5EF4C5|nr:hypothetical protein [Nocardia asteroides]UGT63829.1 hypothetical protein LTT61_11210 [Nocardia asteroides]